MHQARICKSCWQQMHVPVPPHGIAALPLRLFGIRPSRMNPNTCTVCELMFKTVMRARKITIDATVLFADLRGYYQSLAIAIAGGRVGTAGRVLRRMRRRHLGVRRPAQQDHRRRGHGGLQFSDRARGPHKAGGARGARDPAALARAPTITR